MIIVLYKRNVNITKIIKNELREEIDSVLIETPINVLINDIPIVNLTCLPKDLKELAIGFLYSINILNSMNQVKNINVDEINGKVDIYLKDSTNLNIEELKVDLSAKIIDTSCGIPNVWRNLILKGLEMLKREPKQEKLQIKASLIHEMMIKMQKNTILFKETGGCHGAAIFDKDGELLSLKEDIGRHNAIDKVIGEIIIRKIKMDDKILTTTGRLTGESVLKAIRARIPILASLSAAIESGIRFAFAHDLTLIGFVRGSKMNIYTHPERIII